MLQRSLKKMNKTLFILCILGLFSKSLLSQTSRILELDNETAYRLVERLKERGYLEKLNPISLPYTHSEVRYALNEIEIRDLSEIEQIWIKQLSEEIQFQHKDLEREYIISPYLITGSEFNNTERKNSYRPSSDEFSVWPYGDLGFYSDFKNFTLNTNIRFDLYYEFGPDGIDPTHRLYIRNEDSYLGYTSKYFSAYLGRFENQWGTFNHNSTFISSNPRTFDQLKFSIGSNKIKFTSLNGILDNINSNDIFSGVTWGNSNTKRRYLSIKKVDWQLNENLLLSFREGILYSGENVNLEPKYMVPSFVFFFLEAATPRDQVENLFLGGAIWFNKNNFTFHTEIMLDDLITNRVNRGITERNNFSIVSNVSYSFAEKPIRLNLDAELFTYQVYNTDQAEGRYLYLDRGIANQNNDYVFTEFKIDYFSDLMLKGLSTSPYYGVLSQGEQVINQPFENEYSNGKAFEYVLTGTVETTHRIGLEIFYNPVRYFYTKLDLGQNFTSNLNNELGVESSRFAGFIELGFNFTFRTN
jgi:hypothetical protein